MKPKELKYPFSWKERHVLCKDGVLYVPDYYTDYAKFSFPSWEEVFGNTNPVYVEYCSGNGTWIVDKAKEYPDCNWVAIEKDFDRVRKIYSKRHNYGIKNLFIVSGEGFITTKHFFPDNSITKIFINFPDPWPKDRHAKHRIIKAPFVHELARILHEEGSMLFVTDHEAYSEEAITIFRGEEKLEPILPEPFYANSRENYGTSFFDTLWRKLGREIRFIEFRKKSMALT
jgi:tRNA (guanine-N7-)-methyltransferase